MGETSRCPGICLIAVFCCSACPSAEPVRFAFAGTAIPSRCLPPRRSGSKLVVAFGTHMGSQQTFVANRDRPNILLAAALSVGASFAVHGSVRYGSEPLPHMGLRATAHSRSDSVRLTPYGVPRHSRVRSRIAVRPDIWLAHNGAVSCFTNLPSRPGEVRITAAPHHVAAEGVPVPGTG